MAGRYEFYEWQEQYLTHSLCSLVRYCSCHKLVATLCVLHWSVCVLTSGMHTLQDEQDGGIDKLRAELLMVLKNIHKEKQEEALKVVVWCHLGHAYIKDVSEGESKMQKFQSAGFIL